MAEVLGARVASPSEARALDLSSFDVAGFGSGIYFGQMGSTLRALLAGPGPFPRRAFLFSTAGLAFAGRLWHAGVRRTLRRRDCEILGEFCCRGWDSVGPLRWIGGLNRRHPDDRDLEAARQFARSISQTMG
jgi:hypothetical protein